MANATGSSNTSTGVNVFIPDVTFVIISCIFAICAIALNSVEIRLISRKWKKATNFEVILLHLAIADLLSSIGNLITSIFLAYFIIRKSTNTVYIWFSFGLLGFFYTVSMKIVLVIGVERLLAIKVPLKHRLWHISRKTLYRQIFAAWFITALVIASAVLSDYFVQKARGQSSTGQRSTGQSNESQSSNPSLAVGYALAGYMTFGVTAVLVCYLWLLHIIVMRATQLLNVNKEDYRLNPKIMKRAMKKEKATIVVCWIVLVSFLACNVPMIVDLLRAKLSLWSVLLSNLNAVLNPLIYFFKGYIEKRLFRQTIVTSRDHEVVVTKSKHDVTSPSPRIRSDEVSELGKVNEVVNGDLPKSADPEVGRSKDIGEDCSLKAGKSDALVQLYLSREVTNEVGTKSFDQESGMQRDKGESLPSKLSMAGPVLEEGSTNEIAIINEQLPRE